MLLSEAIETLAIATKVNGRSARTVGAYREKLGHLVAFLGDVPVESITTADLRRYLADLMDRPTRYGGHPRVGETPGSLSPYTIGGRARALKRLFNFLEDEGVIEANPARRVKVPRPKQRKPKGIKRADFLALLATTKAGTVHDLRDRAIMLFLADTGCRVGGLCGLQVHEVNLTAGLASVTEKGDRTRLVPFTQTTAAALSDWLQVRPEDRGPWLFVGMGPTAHDRMAANGVNRILQRRATEAGIEGPVNPHSFRHAFARDFLMHGGDLASLADLMGHSSVTVTRDYYAVFAIQELQEKHARHSPIAQIFEGTGDNGRL
ncbi:MAG: tyrosine-type recombinase/integrase, partial [Chloroflexi bacterium]|nr:tyrosine-type recombinase/integrase [Chloroflexota bacterium]